MGEVLNVWRPQNYVGDKPIDLKAQKRERRRKIEQLGK
jgi:hypothetical protein